MARQSDQSIAVAMDAALSEARACAESGDVPVGAVIVDASGTIVGRGRNRREQRCDPTAHAEIEALREACAREGAWRLPDATVVVTLEPCVMCAGALAGARVARVVFGAWDERAGAAGSVYDVLRDRRLGTATEVVGGFAEAECSQLLMDFFRDRR